jgi:hypothetical protein
VVEVALWPAAALGAFWSEVLGVVVVALGAAAFWSVVLGVVVVALGAAAAFWSVVLGVVALGVEGVVALDVLWSVALWPVLVVLEAGGLAVPVCAF